LRLASCFEQVLETFAEIGVGHDVNIEKMVRRECEQRACPDGAGTRIADFG
jgi:hypothetical protein